MSKSEDTINKKIEDIARLRKEEKYEEALQVCNEMIAEDNECYAAYSKRSHILHGLGKYSEALRDLGRLIELRPDGPTAYLQRAEWYLEQGDDKLAMDDLDFVIRTGEPYFIDTAYFYRAVACLNLGHKAEAIDACLKLPDDFKYQIETPRWGGRLLSRDDIYRMANQGSEKG